MAIQNPDFQPPDRGLKAEWRRMRERPVGLARPLLVLAGWRAVRWPAAMLARSLAELVGGPADRVAAMAFPLSFSFGSAVPRVAKLVESRWPSNDPEETSQIDVVAISMGGLIARGAAIGTQGGKRLRIARLFTLGTPHRGARMARFIRPDACVRDMLPGSSFLAQLDQGLPGAAYELVCYARLRDSWVGATRSAPHGREPIWTPGPLLLSHQTISADPLIRTDIARRLRGEEPMGRRESRPPRD